MSPGLGQTCHCMPKWSFFFRHHCVVVVVVVASFDPCFVIVICVSIRKCVTNYNKFVFEL